MGYKMNNVINILFEYNDSSSINDMKVGGMMARTSNKTCDSKSRNSTKRSSRQTRKTSSSNNSSSKKNSSRRNSNR